MRAEFGRRRPADADPRPLRHRLGRRPARPDAAARGGGRLVRSRRLRHEGRDCHRHARHPRASGRSRRRRRTSSCSGRPTKRSAAARRGRSIEAEAAESRAVLVLEPSLPGGAAKTARKGCGEFELIVHGVAAHAGLDPGKGASAIHELARQILGVERLQDAGPRHHRERRRDLRRLAPQRDRRRGPRHDRRPGADDGRRRAASSGAARRCGRRRPGRRSRSDGGFDRPPLERGEGVVRLYEMAREVARALGRDLAEGAAGGGSDGNFTAALGVPTLDGLGPQGDGAHALHEHVCSSDLPLRAALLAGVLGRLAADIQIK